MLKIDYRIDDIAEYKGKEYRLNMAFDNVIRFFDMLNDAELNGQSKVELGLMMMVGAHDLDFDESYEFLSLIIDDFINVADQEPELDLAGYPLPKVETPQTYCFKQDAELIYSAFVQVYKIDLVDQQGKLHWLKFKALLNGLPEDTRFTQIVDIRTRELPTGKGTEEERKNLKKLKKLYALKGG